MLIEIDEDSALDIDQINRLILAYRAALTTGVRNDRGGFPVKAEILGNYDADPPIFPMLSTIGLDYGEDLAGNPRHLEVFHIGGQVHGFIYQEGTLEERFIYMGNLNDDLQRVDIPVGKPNPDRVAACGYLIRKVTNIAKRLAHNLDAPLGQAFIDKLNSLQSEQPEQYDLLNRLRNDPPNLEGFFNDFLPLAIATNINRLLTLETGLLAHFEAGEQAIINTNFKFYAGTTRDYTGPGAGIEPLTTSLNLSLDNLTANLDALFIGNIANAIDAKRVLDTFLLSCSEGAKNSLLQESLIVELIKSSSNIAHHSLIFNPDPSKNRNFREAIAEAARNCGNGAITYLGLGTKIAEIVNGLKG